VHVWTFFENITFMRAPQNTFHVVCSNNFEEQKWFF